MIYELLVAQLIAHFTNQLITWQCISIGIYLGGLGLGAWRSERIEKQSFQKFFLLETHLSLLGALLITFICGLNIIYRTFIFQPLQSEDGGILFFALIAQVFNFLISYWAGMEIPLIASMWKLLPARSSLTTTQSTAFILGLSYFGAFCGSILFSLWLFPQFHYAKTAMIVSFFNFISGFIFLVTFRPPIQWKTMIYFTAVGLVINLMISISKKTYEYSVQNYYYGMRLTTYKAIPILIDRVLNSPPVQQIITPVQTIDLVFSNSLIDSNFPNHQSEVRPYHLYMDQRLQHSSMNEYTYHETMVHVPLQLHGRIPQKVLVLGAGDGLLIRELLKYPEIKEIILVEIDKDFIDLAQTYSLFYKLNKNSLHNPKVKIIVGDAYYFTRSTNEKFDAIFADFPWPFQYDLAKLYSKEFYLQLNKILSTNGFLILDFPILDSIKSFEKYVDIMRSTLKSANFKQTLIMDLNKESFIFAQAEDSKLNFSYQKLSFDITILIEQNLKELNNVYLQQKEPVGSLVNSIFKPIILNISDPRF